MFLPITLYRASTTLTSMSVWRACTLLSKAAWVNQFNYILSLIFGGTRGLEKAFPVDNSGLVVGRLLTCTCVEPAPPIELTSSRKEAPQARRSRVSSQVTFIQSFLHHAWPKIRGPESDSRPALIVVAHVFNWPPARLRHVRGGVGRRRSLISSQSGRLAARPNQRNLLFRYTFKVEAAPQFHRRPSTSFCRLLNWFATVEQNLAHHCLIDLAVCAH